MKKIISVLIIISGIFIECFAQTEKIKLPSVQYEYLVYSFGKTYFDSLNSNDRYYSLLSSCSSGKDLTSNLNKLGQLGWELIEIVGTIGGDQQVIFKRPLGLISEENETALVNKLFDDDMEKLIQKYTVEKEAEDKIPLVEKDEKARHEVYENNKKIFESEVSRLVEIIKNYEYVSDVKSNINYYNPEISVTCNFSDKLLSGNEYSLSEVEYSVENIFNQIYSDTDFSCFVYTNDIILINIKATLTYKGTSYEVCSEKFYLKEDDR